MPRLPHGGAAIPLRRRGEQKCAGHKEASGDAVGRSCDFGSGDPVGGLGGAPSDPRNLWPEPRTSPDGWGADRKDEVEFALNQLVCSGRLPLREAQRAIATDWIAAYLRYVGSRR